MSVPAAYIGVILLWSTTPLAVQWSSGGWGFLFGVTGRMVLGALAAAVLLQVLKPGLPWHRDARRNYLVGALGIYGAMLCVYWGSQYIESNLVAILFALNPFATGIMAALWLRERSLTPGKIVGMLLGFSGVMVIFGSGFSLTDTAWQGAMAILVAVLVHNASAVWIKRLGSNLSGITLSSGSLFYVTPMFFVTWLIFDGELPTEIPLRSGLALMYLGIVGSALGFSLYFYLLKNVEANRVALITLVSPVFAMVLGQQFNGESISANVWLGAGFILTGIALHIWGDRWLPARLARDEQGS